jgi:hypothetical protein
MWSILRREMEERPIQSLLGVIAFLIMAAAVYSRLVEAIRFPPHWSLMAYLSYPAAICIGVLYGWLTRPSWRRHLLLGMLVTILLHVPLGALLVDSLALLGVAFTYSHRDPHYDLVFGASILAHFSLWTMIMLNENGGDYFEYDSRGRIVGNRASGFWRISWFALTFAASLAVYVATIYFITR